MLRADVRAIGMAIHGKIEHNDGWFNISALP
jgi:hypothetical protein